MIDWAWYAAVAIVFAILCALVGPNRGWAPWTGFAIGLVFGIFGLAFIVLVKGGLLTPAELERQRQFEDWQQRLEWQQEQAQMSGLNNAPPPTRR